MLRSTFRLLAAVAVPALVATAPLAAQSPSPVAADWVGTWKGPFTTDGPFGTLTLEVRLAPDGWEVMNTWEGDGIPPSSEVRLWSIEGNAFSFVQLVGEYEVFVKGRMEEGKLKGTLEAYVGGSMVGSGTFELKKP